MRTPLATYRLQFGPSFGFREAKALIPYLHALGVSDIYASPIFKARQGSTHGYDITDPNQLNPELGSPEDFAELTAERNKYDIGWIQDIVPNHMAYSSDNKMLTDVFENGQASKYAEFFDVAWDHPDESLRGKVLAPFLGAPYSQALDERQIQLGLGEAGLAVHYYDIRFPLSLSSYKPLLMSNATTLRQELGPDDLNARAFLEVCTVFELRANQGHSTEKQEAVRHAKRRLWDLYETCGPVKEHIRRILAALNTGRANPGHSSDLSTLLDRQVFKLCFWKRANEQINYRRFFYLNDFICLRAERPEVFEHTHRLVLRMVREGVFTGLRIDHIDGLYDPQAYLTRLRAHVGDAYVVVEKILEADETLPGDWPVQGTTGYDFCNYANGIFIRREHGEEFTRIYEDLVGASRDYERLLTEKKRLICEKYLAGDIDYLAHLFDVAGKMQHERADYSPDKLRQAITEIISAFGVYRTYVSDKRTTVNDGEDVKNAISKVARSNPGLRDTIELIGRLLLHDRSLLGDMPAARRALDFIARFQQLTGPAMAKGLEDTLFYCHNRLISLNEVGADPNHFGISLDDFHRLNNERFATWPHSLSATSTHDTKRGEDVRARINVLTEMPDTWRSKVDRWRQINAGLKTRRGGVLAPDANDEYLLYQTLVGALPFDPEQYEAFRDRVRQFMLKAVREAKTHTSWTEPNEPYEQACRDFVDGVLDFSGQNSFWDDFLPFQKIIAGYGVFNSLSQVLIKMTAPGVPDFYQGCELWDFNLVDPDNRRPVDFQRRRKLLSAIRDNHESGDPRFLEDLLGSKEDGRVKLFLIFKALNVRRDAAQLFEKGGYRPLEVKGKYAKHIIAYVRSYDSKHAVTMAPRFLTSLIEVGQFPFGKGIWQDTRVVWPYDLPRGWQDAPTGHEIQPAREVLVGDILTTLPVSLLVNSEY